MVGVPGLLSFFSFSSRGTRGRMNSVGTRKRGGGRVGVDGRTELCSDCARPAFLGVDGVPVCSKCKGGGRESGEVRAPDGDNGQKRPQRESPETAAANPAACPYCPSLDPEDLPSEVEHLRGLHERIRVLEAELQDWREMGDFVAEWKDRAERAEARVAELGRHHDGSHRLTCSFEAREREIP